MNFTGQPLYPKDTEKAKTFLYHIHGTSIGPESGLWSLFFDKSRSQLSRSKRTHLCSPAPSGHAAVGGQGDHQAAKRDAGTFWARNLKTRMLLMFSDLQLGKHFLLVFHQFKAAAEVLQNVIFRSRGVNRQRIKKKKKNKKIIGKFHPVSFWAALCTDFRPQSL